MARAEEHPDPVLVRRALHGERLLAQRLPVEASKRPEVYASVARERPLAEVGDVRSTLLRDAHLGDDVRRYLSCDAGLIPTLNNLQT